MNPKYDGADRKLYAAEAVAKGTNAKAVLRIASAGNEFMITGEDNYPKTAYGFELYSVKEQNVTDTELNKLYNTAGFNFELDDEDIANIFEDQKVKAIKLTSPVVIEDGYSFPVGTYFVTETPDGNYPTSANSLLTGTALTNAQRDYLLGSTFIVADPTTNVSEDADTQKAGQGFTLTTIAGSKLNTYTETDPTKIVASEKTSGSETSVYNAAFTVKKIATSDKYALSLDNFRYKKTATADDHDQKAVSINTIKVHYGSTKYLATDAADNNYIFKFVESNVVKAKDLLNENAAAIYNIQFASGVTDESELDKYLTAYNNEFYAKGIALADLDVPAYQFIISGINGNTITFKNRETGDTFDAQLFDEGDGVYSLGMNSSETFTVLNVSDKGDVKKSTASFYLKTSYIKLHKVEDVDMFAGYLDAEENAKVTMTFARDVTPTSNKMYPYLTSSAASLADDLTDDVTGAVQWQLVKSDKPVYITNSYYYLNADDKVVIKNLGDTVAYYTYKMQVVLDGEAKDLFLKKNSTNDVELTSSESQAQEYVIKENVDGSVYLQKAFNGTKYISVEDYNDGELKNLDREVQYNVISVESKATDIKTYLVDEAPEVSLSADAAYVSLKSELGNYITMNDERDGIVVSGEPQVLRLFATDLKEVVPSFYITTNWNGADGSRMYLFNPEDSVSYYVGDGQYDKKYQWPEKKTKAIFKSAILNETNDTLTTSIKGKVATVAQKADNKGVQGGLKYFKYQIILADAADADDLYIIRQSGNYLTSTNDKLTWTNKREEALRVYVEPEDAPTANEGVTVSNVSVVATNGAVVVKGAAGKKVAISNILGQSVANTVISSDNATIAAPAGIVVVAVEGEDAVKVVVK